MSLLALERVCKRHQAGRSERVVLEQVSMSLHAGELVAVLGERGSGRSTLLRIAAGIEASTITSLGTCRLVMPRSESTMASPGRSSRCGISVPLGSAPSPSLGFQPGAFRSGKNVLTAWPKMIGSDTFIIVALTWIE